MVRRNRAPGCFTCRQIPEQWLAHCMHGNLVSGVAVAARGQGQRSEADGSRGLYLSEQRHIYSFMFIVVGGADAVKLSKQSR
jgi:hypothetical protein